MEFRWVAVLVIWTFISGPMFAPVAVPPVRSAQSKLEQQESRSVELDPASQRHLEN